MMSSDKYVVSGYVTLRALLDVSVAFDTVDHVTYAWRLDTRLVLCKFYLSKRAFVFGEQEGTVAYIYKHL